MDRSWQHGSDLLEKRSTTSSKDLYIKNHFLLGKEMVCSKWRVIFHPLAHSLTRRQQSGPGQMNAWSWSRSPKQVAGSQARPLRAHRSWDQNQGQDCDSGIVLRDRGVPGRTPTTASNSHHLDYFPNILNT